MRKTVKAIRTVLFVAALIFSFRDHAVSLRAAPDLCGDVCPSLDCATQCYQDEVAFENGNTSSCLDYGVYDTNQMCCGDGFCSQVTGENTDNCAADCYHPPPPPGPVVTVLVNGSFDTNPYWTQPGSAEFSDIAATYGTNPIHVAWTDNNAVLPPTYGGIYTGGSEIASLVNSITNGLPAGDYVNMVGHSHGGNVMIIATQALTRPVNHFIELGTPVNYDLPRYVMGPGAHWRCTASSYSDSTQFEGSSPRQVGGYFTAEFEYEAFLANAEQDALNGDWDQFAIDSGLAAFFYQAAQDFWWSTKIEAQGETDTYGGLDHSQMHEPYVWDTMSWYCKVG
jgi:hypothetical protein